MWDYSTERLDHYQHLRYFDVDYVNCPRDIDIDPRHYCHYRTFCVIGNNRFKVLKNAHDNFDRAKWAILVYRTCN